MASVTLEHFKRAAVDIGSHGDNDTLPFDIDNRFIKENYEILAVLAHDYFITLDNGSHEQAARAINALHLFSERLLVPTGRRALELLLRYIHFGTFTLMA